MKINLSRNSKIIIFFTAIIIITIPLILYNASVQDPAQWQISLKGNVNEEISINFDDLTDGTYDIIDGKKFKIVDSIYRTSYEQYTGISVSDIINKSGNVLSNTVAIKFKSADNYETDVIPIELIHNNPEAVIIAFKLDGEYLETQEEGGTGPLRAIVNFTIAEPMGLEYNANLCAKFTNTIYFVTQ